MSYPLLSPLSIATCGKQSCPMELAVRTTFSIIVAAAGLLLSGCSNVPPAPGLTSQSYSNDHTTAAGGFGLGPEDFNTNGGAFGPDSVGR